MYIQSSLRLEGGIEKKELVVTALSQLPVKQQAPVTQWAVN